MTRRLHNIAVVTSLVLFVVVMGLWVESGFRATILSTSNTGLVGGGWYIAHGSGGIGAGWLRYLAIESGLTSMDTGSYSMMPPLRIEDTNIWFGLGYAWDTDQMIIGIPHWLLALLTLILPVVWLIRRRRKRDPDAVPCAKCGYDLRGSPGEVCPECGAG